MLEGRDSAVHGDDIELQRDLVRRIADSDAFRRSQRLRELLLYISERTLTGRHDELTESRIAEHVFGREQYEPAVDSLVRVAARQLRSKVHEYFATVGRDEEFTLDIPKGGYTVVFTRAVRPPVDAPSLVESAAPAPAQRSWRKILSVAAAVTLLISLVALLLQRGVAPAALPSDSQTLVGAFLNPAHRTHIVTADSALVLLSLLAGRTFSVEEYADRSYLELASQLAPKSVPPGFLDTLKTRQVTSLADFRTVARLLQLYGSRYPNLMVQHARDIRARDFNTDDDFILIGGRASDPWAELYEPSLHFRVTDICFEAPNGRPPVRYCRTGPPERGLDYARVAVLRNGDHRGRVLLIQGLNMEATEAAGEFCLNPGQLNGVLHTLNVKRPQDLNTFELILQTYDVGGTGRILRIADHARQ